MKSDALTHSNFVLDARASQELKNSLKQNPQAGIKQAAQQFEGLLLQMMLKSMRDASPQDGPLESDQTRFFTSILDQQLAQNLSSRGSLGFAKLIEQQLTRQVESANPDELLSSLSTLAKNGIGPSTPSAAKQPLFSAGAPRFRTLFDAHAATPSTGEAPNTRAGEFANRLWPHAVDAAAALGVPAHFLVAHAALETGWGKSEIRAANGAPSYNLFGVKAGSRWNGAVAEVPTTEYINGEPQILREKFRVYHSYAEAFNDYAQLLKSNARYSGVLGQQDGKGFARSLQQSGYATDPAYADKLSRIIDGATLRQALSG